MICVQSAVGSIWGSMVYALSDGKSKDYYLIDIGDYKAALSILPRDACVSGVFITHGHHDHVVGLNSLVAAFPDCIVYASKETARMLASAKANLSFYVENPFEYHGDVSLLFEGSIVELFDGVELRAIATPGHHPSCLCYLVEEFLFTGDSYIPGVKVFTNLPGGDRLLARESKRRIIELGQGKRLCPGHVFDL